MNIFKRIYTGNFELHRTALKFYLSFAALTYILSMFYLMIFIGNATHKTQAPNVYTGTIHYFLGMTLVFFSLCSRGVWLAAARRFPEHRITILTFIAVLNIGFWLMYFVGMYIDKIWLLLGKG